MISFPPTTEFNKRIPKQKFYDNLPITPALKRCFTEQIKIIRWRNKIAASTMNLAPGEAVTELEVFEIQLHAPELDEAVLRQIDRMIPYHILFLLTYEGRIQAWIGYKEAAQSGGSAFKVNRYYHTDWLPPEELHLQPEGLSVDAVYENLVRQIAGETLQDAAAETLREAVNRSEQREKLQKRITALQGKLRREKQLNRQMELNTELKRLKRQLEEL